MKRSVFLILILELLLITSCGKFTLEKQFNIPELEKMAGKGNIQAQQQLYYVYYHGKNNIPIDKQKAFKYIRMAEKADSNDFDVLLSLSVLYTNDKEFGINLKKAFYYDLKLANYNYAIAQGSVAHSYLKGNVVEKDYTKALMWALIAEKNRNIYISIELIKKIIIREYIEKGITHTQAEKKYSEVLNDAEIMAQEWLKNNKYPRK